MSKIPAYRPRKGYDQAIVTLTDSISGKRRDYWLGLHGSRESREMYHRVIAEWEAGDRRLPDPGSAAATVSGLTRYGIGSVLRETDPLGLLSNLDFLLHFYTGGGLPYVFGPADLATYRTHPRISLAEQHITNNVRRRAWADAMSLFETLDCDCHSLTWAASVRKQYPTVTYSVSRESFVQAYPPGSLTDVVGWYLFLYSDWTYSIGGHLINYTSTCDLYADCNDWYGGLRDHGMISYSCVTQLQVRDPFQDPGNIAQAAARLGIAISPGSPFVNFSGTPYVVWIDWTLAAYGAGSVPRNADPECSAGW